MECSTTLMERVAQEVGKEIAQEVGSGRESHLGDMEQAVRERMQELGRRCVEEALSQLAERYPAETSPCSCGQRAAYRCRREGKVVSLFGRISYRRAYYICAHCRQGHYPLDRRFGIRPGQVSPKLGAHLARLGAQTAFDEARELAEKLLLVEVSATTVHKETLRFGRLQRQREAEWQRQSEDADQLLARQRQAMSRPERLYGSLDGVIVPVDEEWRELKVGCWYQVVDEGRPDQNVGEQSLRAQEISYYCDFHKAQTFGQLLWATGTQRDADLAQEVVFVADGAAWIWRLVSHHFPDAVQIVDWFHAAAYLPPVAKNAFVGDEPMAQAWTQRLRSLLWDGQVHKVINECRRLAKKFPQARESAHTAITFYTNNAKRMDYARLRREGYLVGSGVVESGCKQIGAHRLKRAGARWTEEGAQLTAKARAALLSHDWPALAQRRATLPLAA